MKSVSWSKFSVNFYKKSWWQSCTFWNRMPCDIMSSRKNVMCCEQFFNFYAMSHIFHIDGKRRWNEKIRIDGEKKDKFKNHEMNLCVKIFLIFIIRGFLMRINSADSGSKINFNSSFQCKMDKNKIFCGDFPLPAAIVISRLKTFTFPTDINAKRCDVLMKSALWLASLNIIFIFLRLKTIIFSLQY